MKKYRLNAGIVLFRNDGKVLLCERMENYPKRWQFPQGGVDEGETPLEAATRELKEETSVVSAQKVYALSEPLKYDFPPSVLAKNAKKKIFNVGQEQYWFLFYFDGDEKEINLQTGEQEFRSYQWIELSKVVDMVVEFKQEVYKKIVAEFSGVINNYIE